MARAVKKTQPKPPPLTNPSLPKGWRMVRFGDVVNNVNETVSNPLKEGFERFVGLEHLEPRDLRIRSWGNVADGTTFNRSFRAGQVLFGKRRAYQRKAALANFAGICSGDIYVFTANEQHLVPELLPFLVQFEGFAKHAEDTSEGSLSPRTKWKYLAAYEFALPGNPTEQRRIAELLAAADGAVEGWRNVEADLLQAKFSAVSDELFKHKDHDSSLADVLSSSIESGYSQSPVDDETGHYILALNALSRTGYVPGQLKNSIPTPAVLDCRLKKGDFLMSRSNTRELVGLVGIFSEERSDVSFPDTMMRLPLNRSHVVPEYLELVLLSESGRRFMRAIASGTSDSMKKINRQGLTKFRFWLPSIGEQAGLLQRLGQFDACLREVRQQIEKLRSVKLRLLSSLLSSSTGST